MQLTIESKGNDQGVRVVHTFIKIEPLINLRHSDHGFVKFQVQLEKSMCWNKREPLSINPDQSVY